MTRSTSWPPEGTPVIAAADGKVEKLFNSARRRRNHRSTSARPTRSGCIITRTSALCARPRRRASTSSAVRSSALVGHTGNANAAGPHLHFAINTMDAGRALVAGNADQSLSAACREKGQRLGAAAGSFPFSLSR